MKNQNTVAHITLQDGSRVSADFYRKVYKQVMDEYSNCVGEGGLSIEDILSPRFLNSLTEYESRQAFKCFIKLVENGSTSFVSVGSASTAYQYYEAMEPVEVEEDDQFPF